ncbi:RNA polymerase II C-terminal domain phosphatase [Trifolium repens]|nr:RNA polymerase II C-terminal domain phosphatase [Trifolium repens]
MQKTSHAMIDLNQNSRSLSKKDASFDSFAALVLDLDHKDRVHSGHEATKKSVPPFFNLNQISVEIDGQVYGKRIGLTWDEAKMQGPNIHRRQSSPRPFQGLSNKHV